VANLQTKSIDCKNNGKPGMGELLGTGLAETLEDLGSQGIHRTHLELLNWLSYQFML
jgi:hypothetical protein